ncbi:helix-turn-helix domain-containing protein [Ulvibacterium marinum]|uniref:helix-turn-helix domain-containing protein n=1 Tax=Ulvibacterium marinum TaxID=2419782 RepID=UPI0024940C53|nr:helix-turn-helix domain-containing protein [Ulvibacterium marinum]
MKLTLFKILCLVTLFGVFPSTLLAQQESKSIQDKRYVCPPCGCANDHKVFEKPGACTVCGMPLIEEPLGIKGRISNTIEVTYTNSTFNQIYPKLIYPAFFIALALGLLSLLSLGLGRKKFLNPFLAAIVLVLALYGLKNQLFGVPYGMTDSFQSLFAPISFIVILGPLLYFYNKSVLSTNFRFKKSYWLHFVPGLIIFTWYFSTSLTEESAKRELMHSPFEVAISHYEQSIAVLFGFIYFTVSFVAFKKWKSNHALRSNKLPDWLQKFNFVFLGILIIWGLLIFVNYWIYSFGIATLLYQVLWVSFGLFIYWICFEIMNNPKFFLLNKTNNGVNGLVSITKGELNSITDRLESLMRVEKIYLNEKLSLNDVAQNLEVNPKYLSMILNNSIGKSFYEYVNTFRIEEVKNLMIDPVNRNITIEAIANKAGFNSKSSFNTMFKKVTGMTPKEFMKSGSST